MPLAAAAGIAAAGVAAARGGLGTCFPEEKKGTGCRAGGARVALRRGGPGSGWLRETERAGALLAGLRHRVAEWVRLSLPKGASSMVPA